MQIPEKETLNVVKSDNEGVCLGDKCTAGQEQERRSQELASRQRC